MSRPFSVALLGFSDFEHDALASCFRLATHRSPAYRAVEQLASADFAVVDADHEASVRLVRATAGLGRSVFIGSRPPAGVPACLKRPIDPTQVMRELDALVAAAAIPQPLSRSALLAGSVSAPRMARALLVDDSELACRFLRQRLQHWHVSAEFAGSSEAALALLSSQAYDFVFLDLELGPDSAQDGLALCRQIKMGQTPSPGAAPTVVMVSAHQSELDRVRGALAGCDAYLGKPLDEAALEQLMRRHGLSTDPGALSRGF